MKEANKMRETTKQVVHKIDDKDVTFQIHKMNALEGGVLLKFVAQKIIPIVNNIEGIFAEPEEGATEEQVAVQRTNLVLELIPKALENISNEELVEFEKGCLRQVDMMMSAGWQPVMTGNDFGVEEIEYDPFIALILCYEVVQFNFSGFFGGKGLNLPFGPKNTSR